MRTWFIAALLALASPLSAAPETAPSKNARVVFAGGCFWCIESDFERLTGKGIIAVTSGYSGGKEQNPTYQQVSSHLTGHLEVVEVTYDPARISYRELVTYFLSHIDPTQRDGQFCDHGPQYRSAIFVTSKAERDTAQQALRDAQKTLRSPLPLATEILDAAVFWPAEAYHQDYFRKNPRLYEQYRQGCGRDARVEQLWGASAHGPSH